MPLHRRLAKGANRLINIGQKNVGTIAERIVANEFEARGFRVSDLNKDGFAANADLLAVSPDQTLQIQVKGAANGPKEMWWIGYGYFGEDFIRGNENLFNRRDSFYKATVVVLVAVRSPNEYSCIVMPVNKAEQAADLHRADFRARKWPRGKSHMKLAVPPRAKESHHIIKERKLLALYRDEKGWARLLKSR
jgi:hypothetical protein